MSTRPGRLGVGVIGAGRVGAVLGSALRNAGHAVVGASGVSDASTERIETLLPGVPHLDVPEIVERSELVLLAVPDDVLDEVVSGIAATGGWHPGQLVAHTCGARGIDVLQPAIDVGAIPLAIHPAMTFTGTSLDLTRLVGSSFAVTAPNVVLPIAQALVVEMGGEPVVIDEKDRALYHAALAHGANHLVVLVAQSLRTLRQIGVDDPGQMLMPLLNAALDGALRNGESALTGPVMRGDAKTVASHVDQLAQAAGQEASLIDVVAGYRAMARVTVQRAVAMGVLSAQAAQKVLDELGSSGIDDGWEGL